MSKWQRKMWSRNGMAFGGKKRKKVTSLLRATHGDDQKGLTANQMSRVRCQSCGAVLTADNGTKNRVCPKCQAEILHQTGKTPFDLERFKHLANELSIDAEFDGLSYECEMCGKYGAHEQKEGVFMCSHCWMVWNS